MTKESHICFGCGIRSTTARSQICPKCVQDRGDKAAASSVGPLEELLDEFSHDYSEDALGPHTSDDRWGWGWADREV